MALQGRKYTGSSSYRYGFNGKENDPETVGTGQGTQDYGARIYNPSLGKFLSVDPLFKSYPWNSCYAFAENTPIAFIDLDGQEKYHYTKTIQNGKTVYQKIGEEDIIERTYSIEWNGWMPSIVYTTHKNEREEFVVHQTSEGTVEQFDKVQFVTIDETTTYSSYENMVDGTDGDSGNEKMWHYFGKGLQNMHEENMANGNGGGGLNWSRAAGMGVAKFSVASSKFRYFFGKVTTGSADNIRRSAQNLKDLTTLGIKSERQLMKKFGDAFENGKTMSTTTNKYGTTVTKQIQIGDKGAVNVGFFYEGGDMNATPKVSTVIPQIYNK
jgi:RHS repeat-associated protein